MNQSALNEMFAARRNHAMKLAPAQRHAQVDHASHWDRITRRTERSRSFRGDQMRQALIVGALRHFEQVKIGQRVSKAYDLVVEHFHSEGVK